MTENLDLDYEAMQQLYEVNLVNFSKKKHKGKKKNIMKI